MVDATEHKQRADHQNQENRPNALLRHAPPLRRVVTAMPTQTLDGTEGLSRKPSSSRSEISDWSNHPRTGEAELVVAGTAHDGVIKNAAPPSHSYLE